LIREVFRKANVSDVDRVVDEIVAWRKGKNRMRKVSDFRYVVELNPMIFELVFPYFTVGSGLPEPDKNRINNFQNSQTFEISVMK